MYISRTCVTTGEHGKEKVARNPAGRAGEGTESKGKHSNEEKILTGAQNMNLLVNSGKYK